VDSGRTFTGAGVCARSQCPLFEKAGLPLGITTRVAYSESYFETGGGAVTWLSDGVFAQNEDGELLRR
jgi:hypothetical protein